MKKLSKLFLILLVIGLTLSGCGQKNTDNNEKKEENNTVTVPGELLGYYYEQIAGRGALNVVGTSDGADLTIDWGSSAAETAHWDIHATYDGSRFNYTDGKYTVMTFDEKGNHTDDVKYTDGSGYFEVVGDTLVWHNDKGDNGSTDVVFVRDAERAEAVGMPNPWLETDDLNDAIKNAGVEFYPPIEEALPTGKHAVNFKTYISTPGTMSVLYESDDNQLMLRKTNGEVSGVELAGDYNKYSKTWEHMFKGLKINLVGDGKTANIAYFDVDKFHYAFSFNPGQEDNGLTLDEINSMVMGMENEPTDK